MKKGIQYIFLLCLLLILSASIVIAPAFEDVEKETTSTSGDYVITEYDTPETTEEFTPATGTYGEDDYQPPTYEPPENSNVQVNEITSDIQVKTVDGSIADFSMVNSLFYLGSLIQGSFISFENNNNIFFGSLFDSSKFTATLNEEGELNVGQRNGNGDLGRVYITIDNGNLTQDEYVIFIPEGNEPTYIYYNTTEIEFKDGNVSLLGEIVSNNDNSIEKTKVQFNENGFTKVELPKENIYTVDDYSIINTAEEKIIICKKDPLCDVNIDENVFTIKGKVKFLEKGNILVESNDENNEVIVDMEEKTISLFNGNPTEEVLAVTNVQKHKIIETQTNVYEYPTDEGIKYFAYESKLHNKKIELRDNFVYNNFTAFENNFENYTPVITGAFLGIYENDLGLSLLLITILIGLLVFVQYKRKAQMSIMVLFGLALLLIIGFILYFSLIENNSFETMIEIESLEQAKEAVEECEEQTIEDAVTLLGMHTGYIEESFSEFGTAYELIPKEAMEENLRIYLEKELRDCGSVLDGTKFDFEASRFEVSVSLENEINVEVSSIGRVKNSNTMNINEINEEYSIEYNEILSIAEELLEGEYGIPVNSYEGYVIESYVNEDLTERLIVIRDKTGFEFRISEKL